MGAADNWLWAENIGGLWGSRVGVDGGGNAYVLGGFQYEESVGGVILKPQTNYANGFLVKYDPSGNLRWVRQVGARDRAMHVDSSGSIYLGGYVEGRASFGNVKFQSPTNAFGQSRQLIFVARYDTDGQVLWARKVGEADRAQVMSVAVDSAGSYYLAGRADGKVSFEGVGSQSSGTNGMFVAKYSGNGILLWKRTEVGSTNSTVDVDDMVVSDVGECFMMGRVTWAGDNTTIGGISINRWGPRSKFLGKLNGQGEFEWVRGINVALDGVFPYGSLALDQSANVYVVDNFISRAEIANTHVISTNTSDFYMAKFDRGGGLSWARTGGLCCENDVRGVAVDRNGNLNVTGRFSFHLPFATDPVVRKYSQTGELLGEEFGTGGIQGNDIATDPAGNVVLTGVSQSPPTATLGQIQLTDGGAPRLAGFVAKLRPFVRSGIARVQLIGPKEVRLSVQGFAEANYRIETSTDLVRWTTFLTWPGTSGTLEFSEFPSLNTPAKFYRVITLP